MTKKDYLKTHKGYGDTKCNLCDGPNDPYMVQFRLWNRLFGGKKQTSYLMNTETGILKSYDGFFCCLPCFEDTLGRDLTPIDFLDAPINRGIFGFDAETYCKLPKEEVAA